MAHFQSPNLPLTYSHIQLWNESTLDSQLNALVTVAGLIAAGDYDNRNEFLTRVTYYARKKGVTRDSALRQVQSKLENRIVNFFISAYDDNSHALK